MLLNSKKVFAAIAVLALCLTSVAIVASDDSSASYTYNWYVGEYKSCTLRQDTGPSMDGGEYETIITGSVPGMTLTGTSTVQQYTGYTLNTWKISGTPTTAGTYILNVSGNGMSFGGGGPYTDTIKIVISEKSYKVSFSTQGNGVTVDPLTASVGGSITLPSPGTYSGYSFDGWYTSASGGTRVGTNGDSYTPSANITLYAHWSQAKSYYYAQLYFNANGGSGSPSTQTANIYSTECVGSNSFTIPTDVPTRNGYTFKGWALTENADAAQYLPGGSISVSYGSSKTLYAVWDRNVVTITSSQTDSAIVAGDSFSYEVKTNITGCTIKVSGASWLSVSNGKVVGTPTSTDVGNYTITVSAEKTGHTTATQTFTISVAERLGFTSNPTGSILVSAA